MSNVSDKGEYLFGLAGHGVGDFGQAVTEAEAIARMKQGAVGALLDRHLTRRIESAFVIEDGPAVPSDMPQALELMRNPLGWIAAVNPGEVGRFRTWMLDRHARLQTALERDRHDLTNVGLTGMQRLIGAGVITQAMYDAVEQAAQTTPISAMSSFEGAQWNAVAVCHGSPGRAELVTFGNFYTNASRHQGPRADARDTFLHEWEHGAGFNTSAGFTRGLTAEGQPTMINEELTVAHLAAAALHGSPGTISPDKRNDIVEGTYGWERQLVGCLGEYGVSSLDSQLMAEAYFSPLDETADRPGRPRHELLARLDANVRHFFPRSGGWLGICERYEAKDNRGRIAYLKRLNRRLIDQAFAMSLPQSPTGHAALHITTTMLPNN